MNRRSAEHFKREDGAPQPLRLEQSHRVLFGEVDAMAIMWHGNYTRLFEEVSTELRRLVGLSYERFYKAKVRAPVVQLHIDYHHPLFLDEVPVVRADMVWSDAARINIEYAVLKENQTVAATGYSIQLFTDDQGMPLWTMPDLMADVQQQWRDGAFREYEVA